MCLSYATKYLLGCRDEQTVSVRQETVRGLMEARGIRSIAELAERSGINRTHLYGLWKSEDAATLGTLRKLAKTLRVTVGTLIGEEPPPENSTPYERSADIREIADLLATRPVVAGFMSKALLALSGRGKEDDNVLEFVPHRGSETSKEMPEEQLRSIAIALGEVIELRKGALWKEYEVPLVATVSAGSGIEIFETYEKVRQIPEYYWKAGARAVFKVRGHSMLDMGITDNDLLFVKPTEKPKSGEVVVCSLNGSAFVKEFHRDKGTVSLISHNPEFQPMPVNEADDLRVFGVVVGRTGNLAGDRRKTK